MVKKFCTQFDPQHTKHSDTHTQRQPVTECYSSLRQKRKTGFQSTHTERSVQITHKKPKTTTLSLSLSFFPPKSSSLHPKPSFLFFLSRSISFLLQPHSHFFAISPTLSTPSTCHPQRYAFSLCVSHTYSLSLSL